MINVWCVKVGNKYTEDHVDALAHMVKKNLRRDYQFNVIRESSLSGWWAKIDLHKYAVSGPNLYLDLDTVIIGDITPLVEYYSGAWLAMTRNWPQSGHGGFQSSVMIWSGKAQEIYEDFRPDRIGEPSQGFGTYGAYAVGSNRFHGDQEYLTWQYGGKIVEIEPRQIVSYKYHCLNGPLKGSKIVCFHGSPDYWEVQHDWITQALS